MIKCPHCGSTAQVEEWETNYYEDSVDEITVIRRYRCGCGCYFNGTSCYKMDGNYELIEVE